MTNQIRDLMTRGPIALRESQTAAEAARMMKECAVGDVLVCDDEGALCGIVTDRDLRHRLFAPDVFPSIGSVRVEELLSTVRVSDVMSAPVISVGAGTELAEAARVMAKSKVGSLPVVEHDRVLGIVTETDLLRHIVGADACCADVEAIVVSYP